MIAWALSLCFRSGLANMDCVHCRGVPRRPDTILGSAPRLSNSFTASGLPYGHASCKGVPSLSPKFKLTLAPWSNKSSIIANLGSDSEHTAEYRTLVG